MTGLVATYRDSIENPARFWADAALHSVGYIRNEVTRETQS